MIYAIGDIHGDLRKLHRLIKQIEAVGFSDKDRLVFIGDYIDRGPDSPGVLNLVIRLKEQYPNTICLRGNHDQAMLDARDVLDKSRKTNVTEEEIAWWFSYGGKETIASYPGKGTWFSRVPECHWQFLESTEFEYREGPYIFVHAGVVPPGEKWEEPGDPRLWIREKFVGSKADFGGIVVFGHTPQDLMMPCVMPNKIGIDTGAAYGGPLTAVALNPNEPYAMNNLRFFEAF